MKRNLGLFAVVTTLTIVAQVQITQPVFPPGNIAVFKCGIFDASFPMIPARVAPCFVQVFDPALSNQSSANVVVSVAMSTNSSVLGSVWVNHHVGSEGGGISRSSDRQF